jgi:hypothetical protein
MTTETELPQKQWHYTVRLTDWLYEVNILFVLGPLFKARLALTGWVKSPIWFAIFCTSFRNLENKYWIDPDKISGKKFKFMLL